MSHAAKHFGENLSNPIRCEASRVEPRCLRTFTSSQAVLASSAGCFHWTPEGRRLLDLTSGVLVSNLGHNPCGWMARFSKAMQWPAHIGNLENQRCRIECSSPCDGFFQAAPMTAYNAITPIEVRASSKLLEMIRRCRGGSRLEQVLWAASGSEAVVKALWAGMARDRNRDMILATRNGFHGKKGLAGAVTGSEQDRERDPRVKFFGFPTQECRDLSNRDDAFDPAPYRAELDALWGQFGRRFGMLITEPYLGGGGSYHPHRQYLQMLQAFCRDHDIVFILDEVQANFGRTGNMFAFESYGIEPDIVVLGKGLGNGVPVAAAVCRADLLSAMDYGEGSDTWSANPLNAAAVLATVEEFESRDVLGPMRKSSRLIEAGLERLRSVPFVAHVRGERDGMVWGIEMKDHGGLSGPEWAAALVGTAYRGIDNEGLHILGPLARKVLRISPPLVISESEATQGMDLLFQIATKLAGSNPAEAKALAVISAR
jgi:4-aminobutyrate aminotransferase-like enzyme